MADADTPGTHTVVARGLTKRYGDTVALDGVDLRLSGPRIVALAGPNGSGKTTFVKCLLGLARPTSGRVTVDGDDPETFRTTRGARVGYMPQGLALYPDLTVRGNLAFFADLYGVEDRERAIERALDVVDLAARRDARIGHLSGGMQRRVSLACALVHDPDLLVLDEPTVGMDPELRAAMWAAFERRRDAGGLILVSTHYLGEATKSDAVLLLRAGRVLTLAPPADILDRTGTAELEDAFLELLHAEDAGHGHDADERERGNGGESP